MCPLNAKVHAGGFPELIKILTSHHSYEFFRLSGCIEVPVVNHRPVVTTSPGNRKGSVAFNKRD
jgi:hypothetical protein